MYKVKCYNIRLDSAYGELDANDVVGLVKYGELDERKCYIEEYFETEQECKEYYNLIEPAYGFKYFSGSILHLESDVIVMLDNNGKMVDFKVTQKYKLF